MTSSTPSALVRSAAFSMVLPFGLSVAAAQQAGPPAAPVSTVACDAACVRGSAERAVSACAPRIEAEAPGDYEWVYRPHGTIFQEADTPEQPSSAVVRYRGDSIRFMSPGKEWVRAIYECGFDAATGRVAYVRVRLGVLGKANAVPPGPVAQPAPAPQTRAAPPVPAPQAAAPAGASVNVKLIGEPSPVDVRQVPAGAKPVGPAVPPT